MAEPEEISIIGEIERLAAAEPFEAFNIVTASGERYNIKELDHLSFGRSLLVVLPYLGGQYLLRQSQISEIRVSERHP